MGKVKLSDMELEGKSRGRPRRKVKRGDLELDEPEFRIRPIAELWATATG